MFFNSIDIATSERMSHENFKIKGAYEVCGEQDYDCSSEESDTESESNLNFATMSKESDSVGPSTRKTSSKGKKQYDKFLFLRL